MKMFLAVSAMIAIAGPVFAEQRLAPLGVEPILVADQSPTSAFSSMLINLNPDHYELGYGAGIYGQTFTGTARLTPMVALRAMIGSGSLEVDGEKDDFTLEGDLSAGGKALFLDVHPFKGAFRVSLGAAEIDHTIDLATSGSVDILGNTYSSTVLVGLEAEKSVAPVISAGFNAPIAGSNFHLFGDLGAIYTGGIDLTLSNPDGVIPMEDLEAEFADIRSDFEKLDFAPFLNVGVSYRF